MTAQRPEIDPDLPYEEVVERLETAIEQLETGGVPLAESVERYAEGVALADRAQQLLDDAQIQITELQQDQ